MTTTSPTRRTFLKQFGLTTLGACALPSTWAAAEFTALPRSTPAAEGVSATGILDFINAMETTKHELHSFMMLRHGKVIAEGWYAPYAAELKHTMYSMSKSFTSTAVGFAVAEGKLSVEDKVTSFFPDDLPAQISENLGKLRIKHLLTMSVGHEKEPTGAVVKEDNWVRTFLAQNISHEPGTQFLYNSAATYMCSAIVTKVTGQKIIDYLTPRLFEPLGITGMTWEECPRGINTGGWGLSIRTEGLAKFGQLYLQKGQWNGKQIIPAKWVEEATTFKIQQPPTKNADWQQGYAYQFWRCQHNAYRGDGAFGQFTIVLPEQDAVIVMTGESKDMQGELDLVYKHILPAIGQPSTRAADAALNQKLKSLTRPPPPGELGSLLAMDLKDKTFKLESNPLGLTEVAFDFTGSFTAAIFREGAKTHKILGGGRDGWYRSETSLPGTPPRLISGGAPKQQPTSKIASIATWKDDHTLVLTTRYYETPHHDTFTCHFEGDTVTITFLNSLAEMAGKKTDTRPALKGKAA